VSESGQGVGAARATAGGGGAAGCWASAGAATWMRAALVVAVVLAACGLLVVGSRGEAARGDGREVGSAGGAC
jgi:hypothetical protein